MSNSINALVVPISVEGLCLQGSQTVNSSLADFTKLPWGTEQRDHNPDTPFLGKSVMSTPLNSENLTLSKGIHLHFLLPKGLRQYDSINKSAYGVPNRWLITRNDGTSWVVESDYISAKQNLYNRNAITVPSSDIGKPLKQPFVYAGRQLTQSQWLKSKNQPSIKNKYWSSFGKGPLTAFGYGELSFSTYYPNCRSVFGFYDAEGTSSNTYKVLGWYEGSNDIIEQITNDVNNIIANPETYSDKFTQLCKFVNKAVPDWITTLRSSNSNVIPTKYLKSAKTFTGFILNPTDSTPSLSTLFSSTGDPNGKAKNQLIQHALQVFLEWSFTSGDNGPSRSFYSGEYKQNASVEVTDIALASTGHEAVIAMVAENVSSESGVDLSKGQLENILSEIYHDSRIGNGVDRDLNILESKLEEQFVPEDGGSLWKIRKTKITGANTNQQDPDSPQSQNDLAIPPHFASLLNALNEVQTKFDLTGHEMENLQFELYSDWCKYMNCVYPPVGQKFHLPNDDETLSFVKWKMDKTMLAQKKLGTFEIDEASGALSSTGLTGSQLKEAYVLLQNAINNENVLIEPSGFYYELSLVPAPRFYRPKNPSLAFVISNPTNGSTSNKSDSQAVELSSIDLNTTLPYFDNTNVQLSKAKPPTDLSLQLMDWNVYFSYSSSLRDSKNIYKSDCFTYGYNIPYQQFELRENTIGARSLHPQYATYVGRNYVSNKTGEFLLDKINNYTTSRDLDSDTKAIIDKCITWLEGNTILTQSIHGLNEALLQHEHNVQLPISDPLAFKPYTGILEPLAKVIGNAKVAAPLTDMGFMPIYDGYLSINDVQLLDRFGISAGNMGSLIDNLIIPNNRSQKGSSNTFKLNPRITQPARLNFRWLSAEDHEVEMNSHPSTSPICGWVVPNYLNASLETFDAAGNPLCVIGQGGLTPFPGANSSSSAIANNKLVEGNIVLQDFINNAVLPDFNAFYDQLEQAQETIYPDYFAGHDTISVLMGKPMAIVQANVGMDVKGGFHHDQMWQPFFNELQGGKPQTDQYENVNFPIRLGHLPQLNDGLAGFWDAEASDSGQWVNSSSTISLSLAGESKKITMLVDPHGVVHATSGVLPVKTINIPAEYYTQALKKISVTFQVSSVLTPKDYLQMSLPTEEGYQWSFIENEGANGWKNIPDMITVCEADFESGWNAYLERHDLTPATFSITATSIWSELVSSNIVTLIDENIDSPTTSTRYKIDSLDKIKSSLKDSSLNLTNQLITEIQTTLLEKSTGIKPYSKQPSLNSNQHIIDGWLKLSHKNT